MINSNGIKVISTFIPFSMMDLDISFVHSSVFVKFFNQHVNNDAYFFRRKSQHIILSDSKEKSRTKSNTKEFQSTRDPREFKESLLLLHNDTICLSHIDK